MERLLSSLEGNLYFGTFPNEVRPEFVDDRALGLITRYCSNTRVAFGIQSGSDRVLAAIGRLRSAGTRVYEGTASYNVRALPGRTRCKAAPTSTASQ